MAEDQVIWEDSLLIKAYDDSVNLARETLARRIADSTNTREGKDAKNDDKNDEASTSELDLENDDDPEPEHVFKVGDYARATYTDGLDYEGTVVSINEKAGTGVLRYAGYENEEEVLLADLLPSWGTKARREQILYAKRAEAEEAQQQQQQQKQQHAKITKKSGSKKKTPTSARRSCTSPGLVMPPMPLVPPMIAPGGTSNGEPEQDFVAMLTAWYMSGYYTGLYQGRKEANAKKKSSKK